MQIHYPLVGNKFCMSWKLEALTYRFKHKLEKTMKYCRKIIEKHDLHIFASIGLIFR